MNAPRLADVKAELDALNYCKTALLELLPFKKGDIVKVAKDVQITHETTPGWLPYKHLFTPGNTGLVVDVNVFPGTIHYVTEFFDTDHRSIHRFYMKAHELENV